jgi:hypothetical protein
MQESLDASLVRIRTAEGGVVGAGFLVGERQILTCAHVVSQALDLADHPRDAPQGKVSLDFPLVAPHTIFTATVVQWCPPLFDGRGDIAGLELQSEPPAEAEVVRFAPAEDVWEHPFRAFGFPAGYDDGVWATGRLLGRQATNWVMMEDVKAQGFMVGPGFSGTPVWDTELQGVVGMVVAASRPAETKAAFVLPLDVLVAAWPLVEPITRQRVFLSAAPADAEFADRLRSDLESRDIVVWSEQHTFDNGHLDKEERLRRALRAAQAVVVVVSSQTRSSRTVKEHLRLADLYQRRLILVWVGEDEPMQFQQLGWRETAWIDTHLTPYLAVIEAIEANVNQHRSISALLGPVHPQSEEEQIAPRNPYRGLQPFTADNTRDFFGRDRLVEELVKDVQRLLGSEQPAPKTGRILTIIGPSGSGKSSVVMAGLLPRLQQGALPESEDWVYLEPMVPGKHPIEALGLTFASHFPDRHFTSLREDLEDDAARGLHVLAMQLAKKRDSKVVLLIDQFEELFTQSEAEDERQRFIDLLTTAAIEPRGPLLVLLTLRADFSHRLMQYPDLYHLIQAQQKPLLPMEVDDLRAVIEQPAALLDVQLTFEGNLVGDLLFEVQGQVGALPLLQFTLDQLFQHRSDHSLKLSAYREIGGVKGALSQHAERTYAVLPSEEHRRLARALFVRLIDPGATEQDTTRRRATLSEFMFNDAILTRLLRETMDAFIAARLLTTNEVAGTTTIEVSHEAVIREWKRLIEWMREAREDIHLQQTISKDAAEWDQYGKSRDRLYRGSQLKEAKRWAMRNLASEYETAFLQVSAARQRRSRLSLLGAVLLILLLSIPTGLLVQQWIQQFLPQSVTSLKDNGPGSLRQIILTAKPGSTITFDAGLGSGTILLTSGDVLISKNLIIRGPDTGMLSISGTHGIHVELGAIVTISNLTFKDSKLNSNTIITNDGILTMASSTVSRNALRLDPISGLSNGFIVNHKGGILTLMNSTVSANTGVYPTASNSGGPQISNTPVSSGQEINGIYNNGGTLTLIGSKVSANKECDGIINDNNGTLRLSNSSVSDNDRVGIYYRSGTVTINNSMISGNKYDGITSFNDLVGYTGSGSTLTLMNSTISDNGGIGISGWDVKITFSNGTISGNKEGGISISGDPGSVGTLTLTNSTISGNMRDYGGGGGIAISNGQAYIIFCTIYGNTAHQDKTRQAASGDGGGILIEKSVYNQIHPVTVVMQNSIVAGNHTDNKGPDIFGELISHGYNLIQQSSGAIIHNDGFGKDIIGLPAKLDSLRNNGGPTQTLPVLQGSPAIDYIPPDACHVNGISTDQRGMKRPDDNESACDIGAYESR